MKVSLEEACNPGIGNYVTRPQRAFADIL